MPPEVLVLPDSDAVAEKAADLFLALLGARSHADTIFTVALAGGSTPERLYRRLAEPPYAAAVPWQQVQFFWGDERNVPPDSPDSNFRMAREALLSRVPVPERNIHRVPTEIDPVGRAAEVYSEEIRLLVAQSDAGAVPAVPAFDLLLLGMGDDGHTASLFPGTAALRESSRIFVENFVGEKNVWRFTVTPPVIEAARHVALLVTGAGKASRLREVFAGSGGEKLPVELANRRNGPTTWLLDADASAGIRAVEGHRGVSRP